jgi:hypothetical protein
LAIACIRVCWGPTGGTGAGRFGGVSASLSGIAGWRRIVTACGKVAPRSGFFVLR